MTQKLEETIKKRARREDIQRKLTLVLARLTARSGRLLFVPEPVLLKQLGLAQKRRAQSNLRHATSYAAFKS